MKTDNKELIALLKVLLDKVNSMSYISGLCGIIFNYTNFNQHESRILIDWICDNQPRRVKRLINRGETVLYYWKIGAKTPRIRWIKREIKRLESLNNTL